MDFLGGGDAAGPRGASSSFFFFTWFLHGFYMVFTWFLHGFYMIFGSRELETRRCAFLAPFIRLEMRFYAILNMLYIHICILRNRTSQNARQMHHDRAAPEPHNTQHTTSTQHPSLTSVLCNRFNHEQSKSRAK
jgi:hypothetical protein